MDRLISLLKTLNYLISKLIYGPGWTHPHNGDRGSCLRGTSILETVNTPLNCRTPNLPFYTSRCFEYLPSGYYLEVGLATARARTHVVSFEQLIKSTNSTSPCTRPCVFLLAFLETNPCLTLYPTLCFWKQLRGRGILRSRDILDLVPTPRAPPWGRD